MLYTTLQYDLHGIQNLQNLKQSCTFLGCEVLDYEKNYFNNDGGDKILYIENSGFWYMIIELGTALVYNFFSIAII